MGLVRARARAACILVLLTRSRKFWAPGAHGVVMCPASNEVEGELDGSLVPIKRASNG